MGCSANRPNANSAPVFNYTVATPNEIAYILVLNSELSSKGRFTWIKTE
jgi:hypothetical protein